MFYFSCHDKNMHHVKKKSDSLLHIKKNENRSIFGERRHSPRSVSILEIFFITIIILYLKKVVKFFISVVDVLLSGIPGYFCQKSAFMSETSRHVVAAVVSVIVAP